MEILYLVHNYYWYSCIVFQIFSCLTFLNCEIKTCKVYVSVKGNIIIWCNVWLTLQSEYFCFYICTRQVLLYFNMYTYLSVDNYYFYIDGVNLLLCNWSFFWLVFAFVTGLLDIFQNRILIKQWLHIVAFMICQIYT